MKRYKIKVPEEFDDGRVLITRPEIHKYIQNHAFVLGYAYGGSENTIRNIDSIYLFFNSHGDNRITYSGSDVVFIENRAIEISWQDFLKLTKDDIMEERRMFPPELPHVKIQNNSGKPIACNVSWGEEQDYSGFTDDLVTNIIAATNHIPIDILRGKFKSKEEMEKFAEDHIEPKKTGDNKMKEIYKVTLAVIDENEVVKNVTEKYISAKGEESALLKADLNDYAKSQKAETIDIYYAVSAVRLKAVE